MKKIYLFLLLTLSFSLFAQQNCNVGNFVDITNSDFSPLSANYNYGNKYVVANPGTVTALNIFSATTGVDFKLYLYKVLTDGSVTYLASTNLTSSVNGTMTLPITATAVEAGEYIIFLNVSSTSDFYYKWDQSVEVYYFYQNNNSNPIQNSRTSLELGKDLLIGMTVSCGETTDPQPQPTCVINEFDRTTNYSTSAETNSYFTPFTITENKQIIDFKLKNSSTLGQFKIAIYKTSGNNLTELVAASNATTPVVGVQTVIPNQNVTLSPGTYAVGIIPNNGYVLNYEYVYYSVYYYYRIFENFDLPTDLSNQNTATSSNAIFPLEINYNCATASATDFNQSKMAVYPNPATNNIQIAGLTQDVKYGIFNVLGAQVACGMASENASINIDKLSNGMYIIKLENGQNIKFIKE